jgi:hypothetical protein
MNSKPSVSQSDIRPYEFTLAVIIGGLGSTTLSALRVHPMISVGFALFIMLFLAFSRWKLASEFRDAVSLEAFSEDIYLLGYLLTLSALLGMAPRLMSEEANLFTIAGFKLVTTVVGLGLMMIFRQTARRWTKEEEEMTGNTFHTQQQIFTEAVGKLNEGAGGLTRKLDEIVRSFDPGLLIPVAEWSGRAAQSFASAAQTFDSVQMTVAGSKQGLETLNVELERTRATLADVSHTFARDTIKAASVLATELIHATSAAQGLVGTLAGLQPATDAAKAGLEKVGIEANLGVNKLVDIRTGVERLAVELGKLHLTLKPLTDANVTDLTSPMNRFVSAIDRSTAQGTDANSKLETMNTDLRTVAEASKSLSKIIESEIPKLLRENREAVERVQQHVVNADSGLTKLAARLEKDDATSGSKDTLLRIADHLNLMAKESKETNAQIRALLTKMSDVQKADRTPRGWLGFAGRSK